MNKIRNVLIRATVSASAIGLLFGMLSAPLYAASFSAETVGQVSLVIGQAFLVRKNGERMSLRSGDRIGSTDRVETLSNGHVHIRFDDQGFVSVRPQSRLIIEQYQYDADNPERSTVKFHLEQGVVRSISGKAAKSARERYRMNTPIAAIGVRGTDFVVRADDDSVRASVNEGMIIVAPFSDQCSAAALGPCVSNSVELAGGTGQLVELNQQQLQGGVVSALVLRSDDGKRVARVARHSTPYGKTEGTDSADIYNETLVADALNEHGEEGGRLLTWGRFNGQAQGDTMAVMTLADAREAGLETLTGSTHYLLLSATSASDGIDTGLGSLAFNLDAAEATYVSNAGAAVAMDVSSGALDINFTTRDFDTSLSMTSQTTGLVQFQASGSLESDGRFNSRGADALIGSVSLDATATEAGYYFNKTLSDGQVEGLTLWGRP
jgi:hypothetical protein